MSLKKRAFSKGIFPESFEKYYLKITKQHRFDVKMVHVEYVEACSAAFDEAKRDDLIKNDDGKKKEEQVQKPL